ncbi:MAG: amidohydrolase family protein [Xanthomonadales bacterium]|nr:amidohydrolase family protein [Xanthomonadales bacterium]
MQKPDQLVGRVLKHLSSATFLGLFSLSVQADLLISNVTLIDGTGRPVVPGASVLVEGDRISRISRQALQAPKGTQVIDGTGKFLIPGLMDVHIHLRGGVNVTKDGLTAGSQDFAEGIQALQGYLYSGVTAIFDAGNLPDYIFGLRDMERSGETVLPRVYTTGGIVTYPGSHGSGPGAYLVDAWPDAIPVIDEHIARKPDMVKFTLEERGWGARPMITLLPVDLLQTMIEYYNNQGIRSTVHASSELRAREAIFAGVDALAHPVIQGPISDSFAPLMAAKKIPMATTLTIGENYSRLAEHPEFLDEALYQAVLDADEIEDLQTAGTAKWQGETWTWWMKLMTPVAQENIRKIHEAGGVVALGTDQSSGPAVHREMELLAAAGIQPMDIIKIATLNAALYLGVADQLGSIEEGKLADIVLLDADPTADINGAKQINIVIKAGQIIERDKLDLPVNR